MNDKFKETEGEDEAVPGESSKPSLLEGALNSVRSVLQATPPDRWEQVGEPLDLKKRYPRNREVWEEAFFADCKAGVLVLRCSTLLSQNFSGGGYAFAPAAAPRFSAELRGKGWSPKALVDTSFRGPGGVEPSLQILAQGPIAEQLYREVQRVVKEHRESQRRLFNDSVARLLADLNAAISDSPVSDWRVLRLDDGDTGYQTTIEELTVVTACKISEFGKGFSLTIQGYGCTWECRDPVVMADVFRLVDESVQAAALEQLRKVLDDQG